MDNSTNTAFPIVAFDEKGEVSTPECYNGLSKLEYFAGMALSGYCTITNMTPIDAGIFAVAAAKALLSELEKSQQ